MIQLKRFLPSANRFLLILHSISHVQIQEQNKMSHNLKMVFYRTSVEEYKDKNKKILVTYDRKKLAQRLKCFDQSLKNA